MENVVNLNNKYERVDFNNPSTIIYYGHEAKDEIVRIFKEIANNSADYEEIELDEKLIRSIVSFNEVLEENERKAQKKSKSLVTKFKKLLVKVGVSSKEEKNSTSFKAQYEQYVAELEKTGEVVNSQKIGAISDAKTRRELSQALIPFLEMLQEIIDVGVIDRDAFEKEIMDDSLNLEKVKNEKENNNQQLILDLENEIQIKRQLLAIFNDRLNELNKNLVLYKEKRQSFLLQQTNEFEILIACEGYLKDTMTTLQTQASIYIFNRKQKGRIRTLEALNEAANLSISRNAEIMQENTESVINLSVNKGIHTSTIQDLHASLVNCLDTYKKGRILKLEQIKTDALVLKQLNDSLDEYKEEAALISSINNVTGAVIEDKQNTKRLFLKK